MLFKRNDQVIVKDNQIQLCELLVNAKNMTKLRDFFCWLILNDFLLILNEEGEILNQVLFYGRIRQCY